MKNYLYTIIIFISIITLASCQSENNKSARRTEEKPSKLNPKNLPNSVGSSSEILIVLNKGFWDGPMGDTLKKFFRQPYPALPQNEPYYSIPNVNLNALNNKMFNKHRNIFAIDIDSTYKKSFIETKKDFWSFPQRVVKINASSTEKFYEIFEKNKANFFNLFHENELRRVNLTFQSAEDITLKNDLKKNHGISLSVPRGFYIAKNMSNFVWIRRETKDYSQGIMIKFEPYNDEKQFSEKQIILRRNAMSKLHIPGPSEGSYMKISDAFPLISETMMINGHYTKIYKGLWDLENDFMGGPFINYTFFDSLNNRMVTLDGFVYDPGNEKRDKMLQLEAVLTNYKLNKIDNKN